MTHTHDRYTDHKTSACITARVYYAIYWLFSDDSFMRVCVDLSTTTYVCISSPTSQPPNNPIACCLTSPKRANNKLLISYRTYNKLYTRSRLRSFSQTHTPAHTHTHTLTHDKSKLPTSPNRNPNTLQSKGRSRVFRIIMCGVQHII